MGQSGASWSSYVCAYMSQRHRLRSAERASPSDARSLLGPKGGVPSKSASSSRLSRSISVGGNRWGASVDPSRAVHNKGLGLFWARQISSQRRGGMDRWARRWIDPNQAAPRRAAPVHRSTQATPRAWCPASRFDAHLACGTASPSKTNAKEETGSPNVNRHLLARARLADGESGGAGIIDQAQAFGATLDCRSRRQIRSIITGSIDWVVGSRGRSHLGAHPERPEIGGDARASRKRLQRCKRATRPNTHDGGLDKRRSLDSDVHTPHALGVVVQLGHLGPRVGWFVGGLVGGWADV